MLRIRCPNIIPSIFLLLCSLFTTTALHPSPKADLDLICHSNHASECYPRIFQPTTSFQTVHDDQNLPPGLHIRMNLATGVKEAKLNEPDTESAGHAADLVIVDDVPNKAPELREQTNPDHAHPPRPPHFDSSEGVLFASSAALLKSTSLSDSDTLLPALSDLQDLAHSSHWGVTLTRDSTICHLLLQLLSPSVTLSNSTVDLRSAAALLLATAVHNNPPALTAALAHFYNDEWPNGPLEAVILALAHEQLPTLLARMVFLLSGLCRDEAQVRKFVDVGGLDLLAQLFDAENAGADARDRLRGKIANFILDNFLQDDATAKDSNNFGQEMKTVIQPEEIKPQKEEDDSWVKLETEDNKLANSAEWERNPSELRQHLKRWCALFQTSSTHLGSKTDNDSTTTQALESIRDAQRALEKKLEAYGSSCLQDHQK